MASIAITGARGRLGKCFRADPNWLGRHDLVAFSHRPDGQGMRDCGELADPEIAGQFDAILHLAWSTVPRTAEEKENENLVETVDLPLLESVLDSAARAGEHRQRPIQFVFLSTGAVYGNAQRATGSLETDPRQPVGAYAFGKLVAEGLVERFGAIRGICTTILRVSNAYGFPGHNDRPQGVIPLLIRAALDGTPFACWGGDSEKDYLHVDDLSRALLAAFDRKLEGVFNVSSGRSRRLSELIALVEKLTGKAIEAKTGGDAPGWDVSLNRISAERFSNAADWKPEVDLESGIARLIDELR